MSGSPSLRPRVLDRYKDASWGTRFHVWGRMRLCPFEALLPFIPRTGKLLEYGCGHGAFCHLVKEALPQLYVQGFDPSKRKIVEAQKSLPTGAAIVFQGVDSPPTGTGVWDTVAILDVLYLLPESQKEAVIDQCLSLLKADGTLLIKEVDTRPFWKFWLTYFEEWLAIRLVGWTLGQGLYYDSGEQLAARLIRRGLSVKRVDLSSGWLHPHLLFVCKKTGGPRS